MATLKLNYTRNKYVKVEDLIIIIIIIVVVVVVVWPVKVSEK
jgi:t-SNARE complex subunit (syntaxin)